MHIINLKDESGFKDYNGGKKYSGQQKALASVFGAKNLGFYIEVMNPKTFSCPYHYHEKEEELFIVLEGEAIVRKNNEFKIVRPGDLVFYETGAKSAHHIYNHTEKPFKYFVLSHDDKEEVCHYPDSQKTYDTVKKVVTQNGEPVDYLKDEEDPSIYWPKEALEGNFAR